MDAINAIAQKYDLPVIEDAAQSFGATYKGKKSCNISTVGSTSFSPQNLLDAMEMGEHSLPMTMNWLRNSVGLGFMDKNASITTQYLE